MLYIHYFKYFYNSILIFGLSSFFLSICNIFRNFYEEKILGVKIPGPALWTVLSRQNRHIKWPDLHRAGFLVGIFGLGPFFWSSW